MTHRAKAILFYILGGVLAIVGLWLVSVDWTS